jgi:hypothetical protein
MFEWVLSWIPNLELVRSLSLFGIGSLLNLLTLTTLINCLNLFSTLDWVLFWITNLELVRSLVLFWNGSLVMPCGCIIVNLIDLMKKIYN